MMENFCFDYSMILALFVMLLIYLVYKFYIKPQLELRRYSKMLKSLGYKVHVYPFKLLSLSFIDDERLMTEKHNDAKYRQKTEFVDKDIILANFLNKVVILVINVDLLKEVFGTDKVDIYHKNTIALKGTAYLLGGKGLILSEGDSWRRKRKIISKLFSFDMLQENIGKICSINDKVFEQLQENQSNEVSINVKDVGSKIFSSVILQCFLGVDEIKQKINGEDFPTFLLNLLVKISNSGLTFAVMAFGDYAYKFGITQKTRRIKEDVKICKKIIYAIIQQRKKVIFDKISNQKLDKPTDILQALILDHKNSQNSTNQTQMMSDQQLFEELAIFLMAGTDTTSTLVQIMIFLITQNPHVQTKVRQTVDTVIKSNEDIKYENLKKLEYIDWIISQTFRMGTPVPNFIFRNSVKDHLLSDIHISKGTIVCNATFPNQYNPKYFKDPFVFRPERWESQCSNLPPFVVFGFSGGPRTCIGKHLALLQAKITLVKILRRYKEIRLPAEQRVMMRRFLFEPKPTKITFVKK